MEIDNKKRKEIGKRINGALLKADILQKDLSAKMDVPDNTVSYWINGKRTPNTAQIIQIAEITGVSTDYLLGLSKIPTNDPDVKMIGDYVGLNEEVIEKLHNNAFRFVPLKKQNSEDDPFYKLFADVHFNQPSNSISLFMEILNRFLLSSEFDVIMKSIFSLNLLRDNVTSIKETYSRLSSFHPHDLYDILSIVTDPSLRDEQKELFLDSATIKKIEDLHQTVDFDTFSDYAEFEDWFDGDSLEWELSRASKFLEAVKLTMNQSKLDTMENLFNYLQSEEGLTVNEYNTIKSFFDEYEKGKHAFFKKNTEDTDDAEEK